jgi:CheY-like chemotaxis protein
MSQLPGIGSEIPHLRRFARALTGSQEGGDAYVAAALQTLIADPSLLEEAKPRVSLYRVLLTIWNSVEVNTAPGPRPDLLTALAADRNLAAITPLPRQAFLLTAVEGFSPRQAAEVLRVEEGRLGELVEEAGREIAEQLATRVLIIEDEPLIALDLADLVRSLGHDVTTVARTHQSAVEAMRREKPGLVLADIQLADGSSGLEAVNEILSAVEVPVIFVTAFPKRFLTGERPEPAFLVTKPFEPAALKAMISQALFFDIKAHRSQAGKGSGPPAQLDREK